MVGSPTWVAAPRSGALPRAGVPGPVQTAVLFHVLIWTVVPAALLGNLYSDTISAAYWGRDFAFGYFQHPPMTSWIIEGVLRIGAYPILSLLLLAQVTVAVTCWFVYRTARLFGSDETAAFASLLYLASPAATVYAVILNHNTVLAPFWAGTMYCGLRYFERGRWRDAAALGVAVGLAILTKYEIAFLVVVLLALAAAVPVYRHVFTRVQSYAAASVALLIAAPNLAWLWNHHFAAIGHAVGLHRVTTASMLISHLGMVLTGAAVLFGIPAAVLIGTRRWRAGDDTMQGWRARRLVGPFLAFGPFVVMLAGSLMTLQIIKPLWILPQTSAMAVGLALIFPAGASERGIRVRSSARLAINISGGILVGFVGYLVGAELIGRPASFFSADTKVLAAAVDAKWHDRQNRPLRCILFSEVRLGGTPVLWLRDRPRFVNFIEPSWSRPDQTADCRRTGGVAVVPEGGALQGDVPNACLATRTTIEVPTVLRLGARTFPVDLAYVAPEGEACPTP